jgi:putative thioredoxin
MQRRPTDLNIAGAVDLSSLAKPAAASAPTSTSPYVFDATEQDFQETVLRRSLEVPILVDFWADWCGPCKQLSPILEKLADEGAGSWLLAKVDVDSNQAISAQLQIQSIPSVFLALGGRLVPGFQGALPERDLRDFLAQVMAAAKQAGLPGAAGAPDAVVEPPADPEIVAAEEALADGDYDGALAAYDRVLAARPADSEALVGRAWASLLRRAAHLDPAVALAAAPDDIDGQLAAADVEVLSDQIQSAIDRLLDLVRRTAGDDRDRARQHLLELFSVLDPDDERIVQGRRALTNALY